MKYKKSSILGAMIVASLTSSIVASAESNLDDHLVDGKFLNSKEGVELTIQDGILKLYENGQEIKYDVIGGYDGLSQYLVSDEGILQVPDIIANYFRIKDFSASSMNYSWTTGENLTGTTIKLNLYDSIEETTEKNRIVKEIAKEIASENTLETKYDVLYAVNEYIVQNFKYSSEMLGADSSPHSVYDFLMEKQGVCQAYALLAHDILKEFGIESKGVYGTVKYNNEAHLWLAVEMDNKTYFFDPTWNDPNGVQNSGEGLTSEQTKYLLFTQDVAENERKIVTKVTATNTAFDKDTMAEKFELPKGFSGAVADDKSEDDKTDDKTDDKSEDKSEDKTDDKSEDKTDDKSEDKTDDKSEDKSDDKSEDKSDDKSEDKSEDKSDDKADDKSEDKSDDKADDKSEDKSDDKADDKSEDKSEDKSDDKADDKSEDKSDDKADDKSEDKADDKADDKSEDKADDKDKDLIVPISNTDGTKVGLVDGGTIELAFTNDTYKQSFKNLIGKDLVVGETLEVSFTYNGEVQKQVIKVGETTSTRLLDTFDISATIVQNGDNIELEIKVKEDIESQIIFEVIHNGVTYTAKADVKSNGFEDFKNNPPTDDDDFGNDGEPTDNENDVDEGKETTPTEPINPPTENDGEGTEPTDDGIDMSDYGKPLADFPTDTSLYGDDFIDEDNLTNTLPNEEDEAVKLPTVVEESITDLVPKEVGTTPNSADGNDGEPNTVEPTKANGEDIPQTNTESNKGLLGGGIALLLGALTFGLYNRKKKVTE